MVSKKTNFYSQHGFTLIEMMVSITIMMLLIGSGVAGYLSFNDRRTVLNAVDEIQSELQLGQSLANSGRLGGCGKLEGYSVKAASSGGGDTVLATGVVCAPLPPGTPNPAKETTLKDVTVSFDILFNALGGSACLDGSCPSVKTISVTNSNTGKVYEFDVSESGEMTQGAWQ